MLYVNKRTGVTCVGSMTRSGHFARIELRAKQAVEPLGVAEWLLSAPQVEIHTLRMAGRENNLPTDAHACPGGGTLLLLLACEDARARGMTRVKLFAEPGSQEFYRRMGLHHPSSEVRASPDFAGAPAFLQGRLNPVWRDLFRDHLQVGRKNGDMEAYLPTVIANLTPRVWSQWRRQSSWTQWFSCLGAR